MPSWKKVITSGSDAILNQITASGGIDSPDITIDDWGSISASLASIEAGGASQTLQDVTDNGSTTTNLISAPGITINSSGSDFLKLGLDAGENASNSALLGDGGVIIGTNALRDFNGTTSKVTIVGNYTADQTTNFGDLVTLVGSTIASGPNRNVGDRTTAVGAQALNGQTGGNEGNTAIGANALFNFKGGNWNTALGYNAGPQATLTGSEGIYIGKNAGAKHNSYNVPPSQSIYIGTDAKSTFGSSYGAPMTVNEIVIGNNVNGSGTNTVTIGNSSTTNNYFFGDIDADDITIDDWGSVSASLSTLTSDVANIDSNVTLQDATDNGSTTTNNITIDSTGDARLVLDRAANSNDSEIEFKTNGATNWTIGTGQVGSDNEFTIKGGSSNFVRINESSGEVNFLSAVTVAGDIKIHKGANSEFRSIAIGSGSLQSQSSTAGNIAIGYRTLPNNTTGTGNIGIGFNALSGSITGNYNIAIGENSLLENSGTENIAIGESALRFNDGDDNTAIGINSLRNGGERNTALGYESIYGGDGDYNTAIGYQALYQQHTGGYSVAIGANSAGDNATNGGSTKPTNGVYIGAHSIGGVEYPTNEIVIGAYTTGSGNNTVTIGNSSITNNYFSGDIDADDVTIDGWGSVSASLSTLTSDVSSLETSIDSTITPIQLVVDTKNLSDGHVAWYGISDLQTNPNRAYTTWIAPADGYLDEVVVSPEQTNSTTDDVTLSFMKNAGNQGSVTVAMGAAGTNKTFTFGSGTYSFVKGDRVGLLFGKNTNTADLYNVMVTFRLSN